MTSLTKSNIGSPDFEPSFQEARWGVLPATMIVIEYHGDGDPAFGGQADDRVLLVSGQIAGRVRNDDVSAEFKTLAEAHQAALKIPNRRAGSILGVAPFWKPPVAETRDFLSVAAAQVKVGDVLCFDIRSQNVSVERLSEARCDGWIGLHACNDTWSSFYAPTDSVRVVCSTS